MASICSPEMPRRAFMGVIAGGLLAAQLAAEGQQAGKVYRIGFLSQGQPRSSSGAMAAKRATTEIPIVFAGVYAPVEIGLVPGLGHPGGTITGIAINASDIAGKRVQLLKRAAMLSHPPHPTNALQIQGAEVAARTLGVQLEKVPVRGADDFDSALKALRAIDGLRHADPPH